jgi:hypothetical protein
MKLIALLVFITSTAFAAQPQRLFLTNQFGEKSQNYVGGSYIPVPPENKYLVITSGSVTPTSTTLSGVAGAGSLYIDYDPTVTGNAGLFVNVGVITSPSWHRLQ